MKIKTKINKGDLIKLKSFCTVKEIINKTKRQPSECQKIFANETADKAPKFIQAVNAAQYQKNKNTIKNGQKIQTFFQRRHTGGQKAHEKMFNITNH